MRIAFSLRRISGTESITSKNFEKQTDVHMYSVVMYGYLYSVVTNNLTSVQSMLNHLIYSEGVHFALLMLCDVASGDVTIRSRLVHMYNVITSNANFNQYS